MIHNMEPNAQYQKVAIVTGATVSPFYPYTSSARKYES